MRPLALMTEAELEEARICTDTAIDYGPPSANRLAKVARKLLHEVEHLRGGKRPCLKITAKTPTVFDSTELIRAFNCLRIANVLRCEEVFHHVDDWSPCDWVAALAGEVGEAANIIKKWRRGEGLDKEALAKELGDVQVYLVLLAYRVGINLGLATVEKFNAVSRRRGSQVIYAEQYTEVWLMKEGWVGVKVIVKTPGMKRPERGIVVAAGYNAQGKPRVTVEIVKRGQIKGHKRPRRIVHPSWLTMLKEVADQRKADAGGPRYKKEV